jgi:hypothetical protein
VSLNARPMVTAGLANDVDDVAQYAAPIHPATATGASAPRPDRASAKMTRTRPAVATTSPIHRCGAERAVLETETAGRANIRLASTAPPTAPGEAMPSRSRLQSGTGQESARE